MQELARENLLFRLHPLFRIALSLAVSAVIFFVLQFSHQPRYVRWVLTWDVFAFVFLCTGWAIIYNRRLSHIRMMAKREDGSKLLVYFIIVLASFASMVAVILLITSHVDTRAAWVYIPTALLGILLSWILVHTTFTFHYAHLYYGDDGKPGTTHAGGLGFPSCDQPSYLDFAYFSFVIGMTFQVSDVTVQSRRMRRTVLLHGLLSFAINTFVLAIAINLVAGLKG